MIFLAFFLYWYRGKEAVQGLHGFCPADPPLSPALGFPERFRVVFRSSYGVRIRMAGCASTGNLGAGRRRLGGAVDEIETGNKEKGGIPAPLRIFLHCFKRHRQDVSRMGYCIAANLEPDHCGSLARPCRQYGFSNV